MTIEPSSPGEMVETIRGAAERRQRIRTGGSFSKSLMAGPNDVGTDVTITTRRMDRLLRYEPADLTVSVEAGMPFRKLKSILAKHGQMLPLDPPFGDAATVGGVLAANTSGPRRRQYGTARDLLIGMQFALLNGRLVSSGGMVVKNVAGLDMGKLMIGSFGTLGVITVANFKVIPIPPAERLYTISFPSSAAASEAQNRLLQGAVQPGAVDLVNPFLSVDLGFRGWTLVVWFGGNEVLMKRCDREMEALGPARLQPASVLDQIASVTPRFLEKFTDGAVVRVSCSIREVVQVLEELSVPALARAGTGVVYGYFNRCDAAAKWVSAAASRGRRAIIEFAPESGRLRYDLWPSPGSDFAVMERVKQLFDPEMLLNRGRMFRRI